LIQKFLLLADFWYLLYKNAQPGGNPLLKAALADEFNLSLL